MRTPFLALALGGCATFDVNGLKTDEGEWHRNEAEVRHVASFEIHCTAADLQLTLLRTDQSVFHFPSPTIGVQGCGRQAVYERLGSRWLVNSAATAVR